MRLLAKILDDVYDVKKEKVMIPQRAINGFFSLNHYLEKQGFPFFIDDSTTRKTGTLYFRERTLPIHSIGYKSCLFYKDDLDLMGDDSTTNNYYEKHSFGFMETNNFNALSVDEWLVECGYMKEEYDKKNKFPGVDVNSVSQCILCDAYFPTKLMDTSDYPSEMFGTCDDCACEHKKKTYQAKEEDTNVPETYTCDDCGKDIDMPEPDWDNV